MDSLVALKLLMRERSAFVAMCECWCIATANQSSSQQGRMGLGGMAIAIAAQHLVAVATAICGIITCQTF
jgi:hypothetical protein